MSGKYYKIISVNKKEKSLNLSNNKIVDISGLSSLVNLKELYLSYNNIVDISILSLFEKLEILSLSGNLMNRGRVKRNENIFQLAQTC